MRASRRKSRYLFGERLEDRRLLAGDGGDLFQSLLFAPGDANTEVFLKIPDIQGESQAEGHRGEIEIESFSWGVTNQGSFGSGGGGGAGKVAFQDLHVTTSVSTASPQLWLASAKGKHIPKVELFVRRTGETPRQFLSYELSDVLVSSYQSVSSDNSIPLDEITLRFSDLKFAYQTQQADGSPGELVQVTLDKDQLGGLSAVGPSILDAANDAPDDATEAFLKIDGVDGDSTAVEHKDEIHIESFSWGVSQQGSFGGGGGGGAGKVMFNDFHFVTNISKATPLLISSAATGQHIKKATLFVRKQGSEQQDYLKYTLEDVLVSSYQTVGADGVPVDEFSLNFDKIEMSYAPPSTGSPTGELQDGLGSGGQPIVTVYDRPPGSQSAPGLPLLSPTETIQPASFDAFLTIDGIRAEGDHKLQLDVDAFSWGMSNSQQSSGGGGSAGKVSLQDFHFVVPLDADSPNLMRAAATGKHFPKAVLTVRKAGEPQTDYYVVTLEDILVSSFQVNSLGNDAPLNEITLSFSQLKSSFTPQNADGSASAPIQSTVEPRRGMNLISGDDLLPRMQRGTAGAVDVFLQVDGIPGESVAEKHKGEIEISSFSWGVSNTSTGRVVRPTFDDVHVVMDTSQASPTLMKACATGQHIKKAVLFVRKSGGDSQQDFMKIELQDVLISSYQIQAIDDASPEEEATFDFGKIVFSTTPVNPDGSAGSPISTSHDLSPSTQTSPGTSLFDLDAGAKDPARASVDFFLEIDGIKGEVTDEKHRDSVDVESFSWGVSNQRAGGGGGGGAGKVSLQDLHFVSSVSKASPKLAEAVAKGQHIKKAVLYVRKAGGNQEDYLTITLSDVLVSSYQVQSDGTAPLDETSATAGKIDFEYKPQSATGETLPSIKGSYTANGGTQRVPGREMIDTVPTDQLPGVQSFLEIDGVAGESLDEKHKNDIEILSYSWGVSNPGSHSGGGGGGAGKVVFQDIHFSTTVNKASPVLAKMTATGQHIKKATLFVRKAGDQQQNDYLQYELSDLLVSSYQDSGHGGQVPTDQFSLNFTKIEFRYYPQREDGRLDSPVTAVLTKPGTGPAGRAGAVQIVEPVRQAIAQVFAATDVFVNSPTRNLDLSFLATVPTPRPKPLDPLL